MRYAHPGSEGAIVSFKARYGNYIGGGMRLFQT
ncbi:hypothetical protein, partial [Pseudomonas aeruginosa]